MRLPSRFAFLSLLTLAMAHGSACSDEDPRFVQTGGGGGGVGGGRPDAGGVGTPDAAATVEIRGSLCEVTDMRDPFLCAPTLALEGISVAIAGTAVSTMSDADGSFVLLSPISGVVALEIAYGDDGFRDVLMPILVPDNGIMGVTLAAMTDLFWLDLVATIGVLEPADSTGIAAYFRSAETPFLPITGVEVSNVVGVIATVYDGAGGINDWRSGGLTGDRGVALMLGLPAAAPSMSFDVGGVLTPRTISDVPIDPGVLTIINIAVE